jgi:hypothetical protein
MTKIIRKKIGRNYALQTLLLCVSLKLKITNPVSQNEFDRKARPRDYLRL